MSLKTKFALFLAILLWASAFVGIRAGLLEGYSPEGLALLRYIIASVCLALVFFRLPDSGSIPWRDKCWLMLIGIIGIGWYNITLNYGELAISSGMASFMISQTPLITALFAILFLGERLTAFRALGFLISVCGVILIAFGEKGGFKWDASLIFVFIATLISGAYSVVQKPFLKKYNAIEVTTYIIWGGTLFLMFYVPHLENDLIHVSLRATLIVAYLGIFPAAVGYLAWSYVLAQIPASRAVSFLYFMPFIATLLGWMTLGEIPAIISILGGILAIIGVWLVNQSYGTLKSPVPVTSA